MGRQLLAKFKEVLDETRVYNLSEDGGPLKALQEHLETDNLRIIGKSAAFWRKVLLVLKLILRYGRLKFFLFFGPEKSSKEGLEVATPENLKWKKYIRQSENANGSPLEPLRGSKKKKKLALK